MYCELNSVLSSAECINNKENFKVKENFFVTPSNNFKLFIDELFRIDLSSVNVRDQQKEKLKEFVYIIGTLPTYTPNSPPDDMSELFKDKQFTPEIYEVLDIAKWDVSGVKNMRQMFMNSNFNENISNWDISSVGIDFTNFSIPATDTTTALQIFPDANTAFQMMFLGASEFNGDLSKWNFNTFIDKDLLFSNNVFGFVSDLRDECKSFGSGPNVGTGLVPLDKYDNEGYWYINKSRSDGLGEYIGYKDNCDCFERNLDAEGFKKDSCGNCKSFLTTVPDELRGKFDDQKNDNGEYFDGTCDCDGNKLDCNGECGGTAKKDDCNVCAGGNTGKIPNSDKDCAGVCNGDSKIDDCGVCGGEGLPCAIKETDKMTVFQFNKVDKSDNKILVTFNSDLIYSDLSENLKREIVLKVYNFINDLLNDDDSIDTIILYDGSIKMFILLSNSVSNNNINKIVDNFKNYNINTSTGNKLNVENVSVLNSGKYFRMFLIFVIVIMLIILGMCLYKKYYK